MLFRRVATFLEAIKFSHSVFALPFALISMMLAAKGMPMRWKIVWIVIACVAARTAAMTFNRLVDAPFDARNPRTKMRALVTGALSQDFMVGALLVSSGVFFVAAGVLNKTCLFYAPWVLMVLFAYSFMKRVTDYSHFVLGVALALAPLGAWVAIRGHLNPPPVLLAVAVFLWVTGFDILYACQDYDSDKKDAGLHSLPKKLGIAKALEFAKRTHMAAFLAFVLFWAASDLGWVFFLGVAGAGVLMARQHDMVSARDLSRVNAAFFTMNGIISIGLFLLALLDFRLRG